jgi:hypothetical protein
MKMYRPTNLPGMTPAQNFLAQNQNLAAGYYYQQQQLRQQQLWQRQPSFTQPSSKGQISPNKFKLNPKEAL